MYLFRTSLLWISICLSCLVDIKLGERLCGSKTPPGDLQYVSRSLHFSEKYPLWEKSMPEYIYHIHVSHSTICKGIPRSSPMLAVVLEGFFLNKKASFRLHLPGFSRHPC